MTDSHHACGYIRCSSKSQVDGEGPECQRACIQKYADRCGLVIDPSDWFSDLAVSGVNELASRPGLSSLMARIRSNGVRTILMQRPDRLARDTIVFEMIVREFRGQGCKIIAAESGVDLTEGDPSNPTAKFTRQVLAAASELEKDLMVLRTRAAREAIKRRGHRCEGQKPYGHYPGESEILVIMLQIHETMNTRQTAMEMNRRGLKTRSGSLWHPKVVGGILRREKAVKKLRDGRKRIVA